MTLVYISTGLPVAIRDQVPGGRIDKFYAEVEGFGTPGGTMPVRYNGEIRTTFVDPSVIGAMWMEDPEVPVLRRVIEYCWPNGYWGGYGRWFEPSVNTKTGDLLISSLSSGLRNSDITALHTAVWVLSTVHTKNVHKPRGPVCGTTQCVPTAEAGKLVELLTAVITELTHGNT